MRRAGPTSMSGPARSGRTGCRRSPARHATGPTTILLASAAVGLIGALVEILLLRRIYRAPELFQLLATFGVVLIVGQLVIILWGPEDMIGPRAPALAGAIDLWGYRYPTYELLLIALGPLVLLALHLVVRHGRWRDWVFLALAVVLCMGQAGQMYWVAPFVVTWLERTPPLPWARHRFAPST